jgi:hypothetical protein
MILVIGNGIREREQCICTVLDRAGQNKIGSVCIWGGSSLGLTDSLPREREEKSASPGVLLLLAPVALAKPSKLHPVENYIQLAGIASPIIITGIAVLILCLECD